MSTLAPNAAGALVERLAAAGLPLLPNDPAQKYPAGYNDWRTRTFTTEEIIHNYTRRRGLGLRTGDGIEAVDLDAKNWPGDKGELRVLFEDLVEQSAPGLLAQLVTQETPSGGRHYLYRCDITEPSRKLAQRPPTAAERAETPHAQALTIIETRGDGGQIQIAPSPGYHVLHGDLAALPTITPEERAVLLDCARAFDQVPRAHAEPPRPQPGDERPGDRYNRNGGADEALALLERAGWAVARQCGATAYLTRPGGTRGHIHATFGAVAPGVFYPFSTNCAPFEPDTAYSPFAVLATLEHAGDYRAAARALADRYGLASRQPSAQRRAEAAATASDDAGDADATHRTDLGNARRLCRLFGDRIRYVHAWGSWLIYDGTRWARDETGEIHRLARATVRSIYAEAAQADDAATRKALAAWATASESSSRLAAMVELAKSEPGVAIHHSALDADQWLLNCLNGTLDLRTGKLLPHDRAHLITKRIEVRYDATADAPTWQAFLDRIMEGNAELIAFLQRAVGYTLTGSVREQCLFFAYGSGANGKSTFMETVCALLGAYAQRAPTEMILLQRYGAGIPNDLARLPGARMVVTGEIAQGRRLDEGKVKDLTGGDTMTARFMRGEWFDFCPVFKLWIYGNHKPAVRGYDHGIWRRIRLIPFNATIAEEERDPALPERLRGELPGILAWAVQGCLAWQREGLGTPDEVRQATESYRGEMDTIAGFLEDRCVLHQRAQTLAKPLYEAYTAWCKEGNEPALSQREVAQYLKHRGLESKRMTRGIVWFGVGLREDGRQEGEGGLCMMKDDVPISDINRSIHESHEEISKMGTFGYIIHSSPSPGQAAPSAPGRPGGNGQGPGAPSAAARQGGGGLPPGFILVPHETHGVWLSCPISFLSDYYPDKASAIRAVQNWVARGCPEERDPPD
jgi:putative DNA primase/helicase